ncbi:MAG: GAF domain-containing protein, partial [Anaerolineae bacterium]
MPYISGPDEVIFLAGVLPLVLGLLTAVYWHSRKVYHGFGFWILANFSLGVAYILVALRANVSPFLYIVLSNVLIVYCVIAIYEGTEAFFDRPTFNINNHLVLVFYVLMQVYLTYLRPNVNERIALSSAILAFLHLRVAYSLVSHAPARLVRTSRTIAVLFLIAAGVSVLRGTYAMVGPGLIDLQADATLVAVAVASACSITIWTFYFLFLNSARVELDLEDAGQHLADMAADSRRELAQLALLEEVSQLIAGSLDEPEILQRAVEALVGRFGYAEAAISMLVAGDQLEVTAIAGTEDIGYHPGYRQRLGEGIIGHTGLTREVYLSGDIEHDPYYYTVGKRSGSAAGVPMLNEGQLYGVLYIESSTREAFSPSDLQMLRALVGHVVTAVNKARLYAGTQEHLVVMTTLHRISQIITSSLELDRIFQTVLQLLKDTFGYTHISIYLLDRDVLRLGAQIGYSDNSVLLQIPVNEGVVGRTVQTKHMQFVRDASQDPAFLRAAGEVNSEICVPLFKKGNVLGVINVEGSKRGPLTERDVDVLTALAGPVAIAIDNAYLHAQAKSLARIDGLTGLTNRRTFDQTLESEIARAARYDYPLTLIILDVDDFKATHDQWGHPAGDG